MSGISDTLITTPLDTVSVTALNTDIQNTKLNIAATPLTVSTITSGQIESAAESSLLPVIQSRVPGLFVSERGMAGYGVSGGAAGSVSIRGIGGGDKVLFLIDGQPQFAGIFGHALPDTYVASGVERVEIVRGPSSLLYGSNAMGGSINIITRRATTPGLSGYTRTMFGSYSTARAATGVTYRTGRLGVSASAQIDRSNGNREGSDFWLANEYLRLSYEFSGHWSASANAVMTQTTANNPGTIQSPLEDMFTRISRGTGSFAVNNTYAKTRGSLQAYINWGAHKVDDGHAPGAEPRSYLFRSHDYNMGFTAFQSYTLVKGTDISAGIDFVHWGGNSWNQPKSAPHERQAEFSAHVNDIAAYATASQSLFNNILSLNAGARLQHSSQFGNVWIPSAGFILRPLDSWTLKTSFSKGFRAPNLRELYLYAPANPDLRPERLTNYEVELRKSALGGRLEAGVCFFLADGSDLIQVQRIDGRPHNTNSGAILNNGFEIDATFAIIKGLHAGASYAYVHARKSVPLYSPRSKLNARIDYSPTPRWSFSAAGESVWRMANGGSLPVNFTTIDASAAYTMTTATPVTLTLKAENITDRHYEIVYGCPMPGFVIFGGLAVRF